MKRLHLLIAAVLVSAVALVGWTKVASAHSFRTGNDVTISQNQPIRETVFASGRTVDINSEVFGDVFCAGQTVTVSGTVHGDVICAGQTVNVNGKIDGDVRLAGQSVTLGATVGGNASIVTQSFIQDSRSTVTGDFSIATATATLNGKVGRDVALTGSSATIGNVVGRNIKANVNTLKLTSSARVGGNIDYTSQKNLSKDTGAVVGGKVTRSEPQQHKHGAKRGAIFRFSIVWFLYMFLAMLFAAMILVLLFPQLFEAVTDQAFPRPWLALLTGFIASIVMPFVVLLVAITVIGIPLAIFIGLLWLVALFLSGPLFAYYLGRLILRRSTRPLLIMLVGASLLIVLYFIPILGIFALLAALWIGTGMLLQDIFRRTPRPAYSTARTRTANRK